MARVMFRPSLDYDQSSRHQEFKHKADNLSLIKARIKEGRHAFTEKQRAAVDMLIFFIEQEQAGQLGGRSAMEETARRLGINHKTLKEHVLRAFAKSLGLTYQQILARTATVRTR